MILESGAILLKISEPRQVLNLTKTRLKTLRAYKFLLHNFLTFELLGKYMFRVIISIECNTILTIQWTLSILFWFIFNIIYSLAFAMLKPFYKIKPIVVQSTNQRIL